MEFYGKHRVRLSCFYSFSTFNKNDFDMSTQIWIVVFYSFFIAHNNRIFHSFYAHNPDCQLFFMPTINQTENISPTNMTSFHEFSKKCVIETQERRNKVKTIFIRHLRFKISYFIYFWVQEYIYISWSWGISQ